MSSLMDVNALQRDALREVANIGAGHAATALSQMTGRRIMISVPEIRVLERSEVSGVIAEAREPITIVSLHMLGDLTGETLLAFGAGADRALASLLLRREVSPVGEPMTELEVSAIQEVGNILASAYLNALATLMGLMLLPSVPRCFTGPCHDVLLQREIAEAPSELAFTINTEFRMESETVEGKFLLLPDPASLRRILDHFGLS
jgi:chemotaxis protein CheC